MDGEKWRWNRPGEEEGVGKAVEDVDDDVVVGHGVDLRPRELPIYQNPLQPSHILHSLPPPSEKKKKSQKDGKNRN